MTIKGLQQLNKLALGFGALQKRLPGLVGMEAVGFYKYSFTRGGFIDTRLTRWPQRKEPKWPVARRSRERLSRSLLIKTGRLRRSIGILAQSPYAVKVGSKGVPYAAIHNEGGVISQTFTLTARQRRFAWAMFYRTGDKRWKALALKQGPVSRKITIPPRQFIGESAFLEKRLAKVMEYEVTQIFKSAGVLK